MKNGPTNLTLMISAVKPGDRHAADQLLPTVYDDLRRLARFLMAREQPGQTLQPTALVHEAYAEVAAAGAPPTFENRRHFFNTAALVMRRILIDRHRRVTSDKHGGGRARLDIDEIDFPVSSELTENDYEHLDDLLDELESHNARWSEIVHLRYFAGLTLEATADTVGVALATVKSDWTFARSWLKARLTQLSS